MQALAAALILCSCHALKEEDVIVNGYARIVITPSGRTESQQRDAAAACARYNQSYGQIDADLALWAMRGISQEDMKRTIRFNTTTSHAKVRPAHSTATCMTSSRPYSRSSSL